MSYLVSLHEDMREPVEIFCAAGHEHAADIADSIGMGPATDRVFVKCPRGTVREIELVWSEETEVAV